MRLPSLTQPLALLCAGGLLTACALANGPSTPSDEATVRKQPINDAWIDTRLEMAYLFNLHLDNFAIQTDVDDGVVLLTGTVQSDTDKDLAEEIAKSLKGVASVKNHLVVNDPSDAPNPAGDDQKLSQKVSDAATTAHVKTQLIANKNLSGLSINVDTENAEVTLTGEVGSHAEKQLAELIAKNTPDVQSVSNELRVVPPDDNEPS